MLVDITEVAYRLNAINYDIVYSGFLKRKKKLRIFVKGVLFTEIIMDKKTVIDSEIEKVCNHYLVLNYLLKLCMRKLAENYNVSISIIKDTYNDTIHFISLNNGTDNTESFMHFFNSYESMIFETFLIKNKESGIS